MLIKDRKSNNMKSRKKQIVKACVGTQIVLLYFALVSSACKAPPLQPARPATFSTICSAEFGAFYDERNYTHYRRATISGYIALPNSVMISDTMMLDFYEKPNRGGRLIYASFKVGSGKNEAGRLQRDYKISDLAVNADNGEVLRDGSHVLLEGTVSPGSIPGKLSENCYIRVEKILPK